MRATIDIDTGGTFTDGFVALGERFVKVKVPTTPHDLTVCFNACLEAAAGELNLPDAASLLAQTEVVRYATTLSTNTLLQRNGPKLGLLVTRGYEASLYGPPRTDPHPLYSILLPQMVIGIAEGSGVEGAPLLPVDEAEVRRSVKFLLERGARMIVVSFRGAHRNPANELRVRQILEADFPKHYLGCVPLLLGHQVSQRYDDASRANAAIINAYLHKEMVRYLYKADDDLRRRNYGRPLLIVHANGGAARVAKTKAISTYNSGPAAGLLGADEVRRLYGLENVLTLDVGGTSSDVSIIAAGQFAYTYHSSIHGIPVDEPMIEVHGVGAGGSSIATVELDAGGAPRLRVGPESAGSVPGPASFGQGGTQPTGTDAFLILGFVDPDYFLGGRRKLDAVAARRAIQEKIAGPLGISVEAAAQRIVHGLETVAGNAIRDVLAQRQLSSDQFALFAFGGAGGLLSPGIARVLGLKTIYTFPFSTVFCAYGSSILDIVHTYERPLYQALPWGAARRQDFTKFTSLAEEMRAAARRDMRGEGFPPDEVRFTLEVEMSLGDGADSTAAPNLCSAALPILAVESEADAQLLAETCRQAARTAIGSGTEENGGGPRVLLETLYLKASAAVPHYRPVERPEEGPDPAAALSGRRDLLWGEGVIATPVYRREALRPGNVVEGPAVVEANDTTYLVPRGANLRINRYDHGIMSFV